MLDGLAVWCADLNFVDRVDVGRDGDTELVWFVDFGLCVAGLCVRVCVTGLWIRLKLGLSVGCWFGRFGFSHCWFWHLSMFGFN